MFPRAAIHGGEVAVSANAARKVKPMADLRQRDVVGGAALRRLPVGAEVQPGGGVHFRLWAAKCRRVSVQISRAGRIGEPISLRAEENGYFSALVAEASAGDLYWLLVDDDDYRLPDPASRFQPEGPHGPSEIIDAATYR